VSLPETTLRVAVVQMAAGADPAANWRRARQLLDEAGPADLVALPEVFHLRGSEDDYRRKPEPVPGPLTKRLSAWAAKRKTWLLAGSVIEKTPGGLFNTSLLFDRRGRLAATYRKIHLFEAHLENGKVIRESDTYQAGLQPVMATVEGWQCGLAICYDLRFPELFRLYSRQGAHLFFLPSNFTQRTGRDHWEVLVRARAIENQCFVVAPNQCGANPHTGIASHGHSLIVGPWGEVLAAAADEEGVLRAELDPHLLRQTRRRIPALQHRRL
jgi:predicted amidohydrolase